MKVPGILRFLSKLGVMLLSLLFCLGVCEVVLRARGYRPGYMPRYRDPNFRPVARLEVFNTFLTDEEGVFRANPDAQWDSECRINASGFRSEPFQKTEDGRSSILLLGDSFAWGASAKPITNSFADIVRRAGYHVYNAGIPATDPKQYAYLAEKWIPILDPDVVAVALYMGNDIRRYWPMLPYKNLRHVTNAGWLRAYDDKGEWMSAETAYLRGLQKGNRAYPYLRDDRNTLKARGKRAMMKSAVGTVLWVYLATAKASLPNAFAKRRTPAAGLPSGQTPAVVSPRGVHEDPRSGMMAEAHSCLTRIRHAAHERGSSYLLFIIPERPDVVRPEQTLSANRVVFEGFTPLVPRDLTTSHYTSPPSKHFNNQGHLKFAGFMLEHVQHVLASRTPRKEQGMP